ncbi:MAG: hypothetical protein RLZ10_1413 [Bacteroidota bacterium]|jgi:hypothetical protein
MKILLSEEQAKKIILELKDTKHVAERLVERCLHDKLPVALLRTLDLGYGQTMEQLDKVGNYTFTDNEKNELKDKIVKLFSYDYNKKSYGVVLQKFDIRNRLKNVEFYGKKSEEMAMKYINQKGCGLYFVDFDDEDRDIYNREKYADAVALIIRDNEAITAMWGRAFKFNKTFFKTDFEISKIDSIIKNGAIRSSEIPDRIKNIFNVSSKSDEKSSEEQPEDGQTNDLDKKETV